MANKDPYGMAIRLPNDMVEMLKKLRDEQNLPSMATAVKFWVEQQATERREMELASLRGEIEKLVEIIPICQATILKAHWKIDALVDKMKDDTILVDKEGKEVSLSDEMKIIDDTPPSKVLKMVQRRKQK